MYGEWKTNGLVYPVKMKDSKGSTDVKFYLKMDPAGAAFKGPHTIKTHCTDWYIFLCEMPELTWKSGGKEYSSHVMELGGATELGIAVFGVAILDDSIPSDDKETMLTARQGTHLSYAMPLHIAPCWPAG